MSGRRVWRLIVRIAVVGTGSIGRRHIGNLLRLGYDDVFAVSEKKKIKTLEVGSRTIPVVDDVDAALHSAVDTMFICNPTNLHFRYLEKAIEAGKHVFVEKPVGSMMGDFTTLRKKSEQKKLIIGVGHQFRFNPHLEELREKVKAKFMGTIFRAEAIQGEHIADYHPDEDYRESYAAKKDLGGGVLLTQIHQIDYLNWIFGPFSRVFGVSRQPSILDIDVEESVSYFLESHSGCPIYGHMDFLARPKTVSIQIMGDEHSMIWDYYGGKLICSSQGNVDEKPTIAKRPFNRNQMFLDVVRDFLKAVASDEKPRSDLADGVAALRIVEGIKESISSGRVVEIDS